MVMKTKTIQELVDVFNEDYSKACNTSKPEDWLNAALAGRHLVNGLCDGKLTKDIFPELQKQEQEQGEFKL